ncbi:MAG: VanW family protein [Bacteroidales bacterium]|nr:VanW family protein [Bacteroidales bacterium]
MKDNTVEKPKFRSKLRKKLGKEFFIILRHLQNKKGRHQFAKQKLEKPLQYSVTTHKSFLVRPLKNVDMHLQYNKITNLRIAINRINTVIIKPGQTFSIWKLVGRPTKHKGYLEGLSLNNGKITTDIGGGLCQLGNLLYWMVLHTPLTVIERWRHSYDVFPDINRTIPFACGATLSYNYIDLQFRNDTTNTFQILLWLDEKNLNGEIKVNEKTNLKYEIYETDHAIKHQWWGGFTRHNKIWKRITNTTDLTIKEELVTENNAIMMYNPVLEEGEMKSNKTT